MAILKINMQKAVKNLIKLSPFILFTAIINILFADLEFAILIGIRLILVCNLSYIFAKTISYTQVRGNHRKINVSIKNIWSKAKGSWINYINCTFIYTNNEG